MELGTVLRAEGVIKEGYKAGGSVVRSRSYVVVTWLRMSWEGSQGGRRGGSRLT